MTDLPPMGTLTMSAEYFLSMLRRVEAGEEAWGIYMEVLGRSQVEWAEDELKEREGSWR